MELRSIQANGLTLRWHERGVGPPVVFLHGIPTGPRLWRYVLPRVAGARALAWEMVGYGSSIPESLDAAGAARDISVTRQADYLAWWMDEIGLESAVLVGHDLGGGVAQIAALRYPGKVRGLVLVNCVCYDKWPIPEVKALRAAGALVARLPDAVTRLGLLVGLFMRGHDRPDVARESLRIHWEPYESAGGAAALIRQVRSLDAGDTMAVADNLPQILVPVRLVWGTADPFQKIGYGYRLAHDLRAPLDRVEGASHFVPEDHPDRVAAEVNGLLERLRVLPAA